MVVLCFSCVEPEGEQDDDGEECESEDPDVFGDGEFCNLDGVCGGGLEGAV